MTKSGADLIHWDSMELKEKEWLEEFLAWRLFEHDFQDALRGLALFKEYSAQPRLAYPLFRDVVITYIRPFKRSVGKFKSHKISSKNCVPAHLKALHDELVRYRDTVFAHTDIGAKNPDLARWKLKDGVSTFPMSFKNGNLNALLKRADEVKELVEVVLTSTAKTIAQGEVELREKLDTKDRSDASI